MRIRISSKTVHSTDASNISYENTSIAVIRMYKISDGEFEKIEAVDYPIYLDVLEKTLKEAGYGRAERDIIIRTLRQSIPTKE